MGRPNISPRGSGDPKPEPELSLLSYEPFDAAASSATAGPLSPEKNAPRLLVDLLEEEAIDDEQGREEEEKKKEKEEEEEMELVCIKCVLCLSKK